MSGCKFFINFVQVREISINDKMDFLDRTAGLLDPFHDGGHPDDESRRMPVIRTQKRNVDLHVIYVDILSIRSAEGNYKRADNFLFVILSDVIMASFQHGTVSYRRSPLRKKSTGVIDNPGEGRAEQMLFHVVRHMG